MLYPRFLSTTLQNWLFKQKILVITGARQVGKTTLLETMMDSLPNNTLYMNADEPATKNLFSDLSFGKLQSILGNNEVIVIDEAQQIENIGLCLKLMADRFKDKQIVVTGSSALEIANKVFEPLTGRHLLFHLYPLSLLEIYQEHEHKQLFEHLPRHLVYGMYPDAINHPMEAEKLIKSLAGQYLYKDVLAWKDIRKPELLHKLLQLLAHQMTHEVSMQELAVQLKVKSETVETYLDLLEKSFVVFRLRSHSTNDRKEVSKMKKIYFWDNGIRNALIDQFSPLELRNDTGALWENFAVTERMKLNHYFERNVQSKFWRSKQQQEVDYVEVEKGQLKGFEMKFGVHQKARITKAFTNLYPEAETQLVHPDNFLQFLGRE